MGRFAVDTILGTHLKTRNIMSTGHKLIRQNIPYVFGKIIFFGISRSTIPRIVLPRLAIT